MGLNTKLLGRKPLASPPIVLKSTVVPGNWPRAGNRLVSINPLSLSISTGVLAGFDGILMVLAFASSPGITNSKPT